MLRITEMPGSDSVRTLRLEGKLLGPWVGELRHTCARAVAPASRLCLDLSGVIFVDAAGVELLRELVRRGAMLTVSDFVAELLREEPSG